jgi:hypothetical protein
MEVVVSKLTRANSTAIRTLASTSHSMLKTVLECCSCLAHFDTTRDGSNTTARCVSRLVSAHLAVSSARDVLVAA